ncbi:hypothetical protein [Chryseobacterium sp. SIMBA_028]|uniref:hypothetical protein n=1 Tax=Chryseobacterium sp. SIMBA_028 TaxID=3085771 RepID=UPI003978C9C1
MNIKFLDSVLKYFTVIICCAVVGLFVQEVYSKNNPHISGNIVFWIASGSAFIVYAIIIVLLNEILPKLNIGKFFKNKNSLNEAIQNEVKTKNNFSDTLPEKYDMDVLRNMQKEKKLHNDNVKLQVALEYTRNQFALYVTDEGLDALCNAVSLYSKKEEIPNDISVHTKGLTNLDLYHFGWNIWNYFKPIKQEGISKLLKTVFVSLDDIDLDSIKSHLKDEPKKGNIKIQEDLTYYQRT